MRRLFIQTIIFIICGYRSVVSSQEIPILRLASAIEKPEKISLSDFIESVTYIPLATDYNFLVDRNPKVYLTGEYILTVTPLRCIVFNRNNGELVREIGHYGRGPEEFQSTKGFLNDKIPAIYFMGWNGNLLKYTLDGTFRGNIKIPGYSDSFDSPLFPMNYSNINNSAIVCDLLIATGTEPNLLMIFDEKGNVLRMVPNTNILKDKQKFVLRTGETGYHHFNGNVYFQTIYNDTVFQVSVDGIKPYFIFDGGKFRAPFESKWWSFEKQLQSNFINQLQYFENERHILFNFYYSKKKHFAVYDKTSKLLKVTEITDGIRNDVDGFMNITFNYANSKGELAGILLANEVVKWIKQNPDKFNALNSELRKKLETIEMYDNPIVVIARLKK